MLIYKKLDDMVWDFVKRADEEAVNQAVWQKVEDPVNRSLEASDLAEHLFGALSEKLDETK